MKLLILTEGGENIGFGHVSRCLSLCQAFEARGATPDKDLVSYCRLSHRASLIWFTARYLLGYPRIRSYDGSWTEWGSMVGMPVEI